MKAAGQSIPIEGQRATHVSQQINAGLYARLRRLEQRINALETQTSVLRRDLARHDRKIYRDPQLSDVKPKPDQKALSPEPGPAEFSPALELLFK